MKRPAFSIGIAVAALLCVPAAYVDARALLATYLAAWWFWAGLALGGLANVWLHNLTGGTWGEAIRAPLLRAAQPLPWACVLFLPVLAGMDILFPWAATADLGPARWSGDLAVPGFKSLWLSPLFFIGRSLAYLVIWSLLAWLSARPALQRSKAFSAAALIVYGFSVSLAAVDWIMSLLPEWRSSVFGWLAGTGQMMASMALAIVFATQRPAQIDRKVLPDLGNLLLMYVMTWAYLAFVQFLIIWAENLPHEIVWYVRRSSAGWLTVAWILVWFHFALPLLILLSRHAKQAPRLMRGLALGLLAAHLLDCWWLVVPSLDHLTWHWLWMAPLTAAVLGAIAWVLFARAPRPRSEEAAHV